MRAPKPFTGSGIFIKIHKQPHTERSHILGSSSKHFLKVAMQSSGLKDNFTTRLTHYDCNGRLNAAEHTHTHTHRRRYFSTHPRLQGGWFTHDKWVLSPGVLNKQRETAGVQVMPITAYADRAEKREREREKGGRVHFFSPPPKGLSFRLLPYSTPPTYP